MIDFLRLRTAAPKDEATVRRVLERSYALLLPGHYDAHILSEALPLLTIPDVKLLNSGRYYIAEDAGGAIACGGWSLEPPSAADAARIRRFAVVPESVGQGVGRRLFERCEGAIRQREVKRMVVRSTINAEPFYAALGFQPVRSIDMPLPSGAGMACILMERPL